MIHSPPKVVRLTVDLHENFVQVPLPVRICTHPIDPISANFRGEHRTKRVPPEPNRFVADVDAALVEQILDIAERQWKPDIHHHRKANDLGADCEVPNGEHIVMAGRLFSARPQTGFF